LPIPAFIFGGVLAGVWHKNKFGKVVSIFVALGLFSLSFKGSVKIAKQIIVPNAESTREITTFIAEKAGKEPFNFALLSGNNYDSAYRYFFDLGNLPAEYSQVTQQLFVVCEGEEVCQPEGNPKWEIAVFDSAYDGKLKRVGQWQFYNYIQVIQFKPQEI